MSERQDDEPIFKQDDVDPWLEALDNVLHKQNHESGRVRARGTTPPPGVPFVPFAEATVVTPALEPLPALPADDEAEPVAVIHSAPPVAEPVAANPFTAEPPADPSEVVSPLITAPPPRPSQRAVRVEEPVAVEPPPPAAPTAPAAFFMHPSFVHPALPADAFGPVPAMQQHVVHEAPTPRIEAGDYVARTRMWSFVVDEAGRAIELGSGRFAKAFLGEERWLESKTRFSRPIAIKCLQRGVTGVDVQRFQIEKTILERVQGHPNIIELMGSGESGSPGCSETFIPPQLRDKIVNDFMILELLDGSLEDLLRGARNKRRRDDLLSLPNPERLFRVLDYVLPVATGVEFAHLVRDVCHRDIKPANILVKFPEPSLRGSQLKVKLADFNVGNIEQREERLQSTPGTLYFQSPEQATNTFEVLCNCTRGSAEVQLFEDFYIDIARNDGFSLFNHEQQYQVIASDRVRKRILLDRPYAERDEMQVRGQIIKAVGRPADVYAVGALLYYLISGATGNPKALFDSFKRFAEYDRVDETNTVAAYLEHEYKTIASMRAPKPEQTGGNVAPEVAFEDRFFSYKQYLDGNGELIDQQIMLLIAKAMIRNKPDSYCHAHDLQSEGISTFVHDLLALYVEYGVDPHARYARTTDYHPPRKAGPMRRAFDRLFTKS